MPNVKTEKKEIRKSRPARPLTTRKKRGEAKPAPDTQRAQALDGKQAYEKYEEGDGRT